MKKGPGPGRPKGSHTVVPASIKRIFREIGEADPTVYKRAILKGLNAGARDSLPYVKLAAAYLDGLPAQTVLLQDEGKLDLFALREIFYAVEAARQAAALDAGGDRELPKGEPPKPMISAKVGGSE